MYKINRILTKDEIDALDYNKINIVGATDMRPYNNRIHEYKNKIVGDNKFYAMDSNFKGKIIGFCDCGNNNYIAIRKKNNCFVVKALRQLPKISIGVLTILILIKVYDKYNADKNTIRLENGVEIDLNNQPTIDGEEAIEFPGLNSEYILNSNNNSIKLYNPKNNTVYFKYSIIVDNISIYESDWLTPSKMIEAKIGNLLDDGSYDAVVKIDTLDVITEQPCTGANINTVFTIKN